MAEKIQEEQNNLRANIAENLASRFRNSDISAQVDPKTGTVTLLMDQNLLFETNSARLSKLAKKQLAKIVPIYAEVLFEEKEIQDQIASFNVEGHASPTFSTGYVDPLESEPGPYNYNLNLSTRRATSITRFIFGNEISKFPYKKVMRKMTQTIGHGYNKPVLKSSDQGRHLASTIEAVEIPKMKGNIDCKEYNCPLSQRVELSFTLKDDPEVIEKIIQFQESQL
jgi:outer membrane protein OmpA-like peptidoglycan-associated protein